ncbi:MAG: hypothetical protein KatS3mg124_2405 [Porticoccaceae bacterium]|nr:MAG: hypothetical protein KatS3mg124_2405 [Porticoccaceae bacterium]
MAVVALSFDMRAPPFGAPPERLYPAALEMIAYADRHGFDQVVFPEHHASPDGYNPVPALLAAAAAARTEGIALVLGAIVLPLHDPVEVAEWIAVADQIAAGRIHAVLVAGYAESDFRLFGKSLADRARAMDEGLEVLTRALAGERFPWRDREVFVRPLPRARPPHLYVGGGVAAAARRAARFGLGFWPLTREEELVPLYQAECRRLGREPGPVLRTAVGVHVAEDPERAWAELGPHLIHLVQSYAQWAGDEARSSSPFHGLDSVEKIRASGLVRVVTPDEAVALARHRPISLTPLISGLDPERGWESLELFVARALPRIRAEAQPSAEDSASR